MAVVIEIDGRRYECMGCLRYGLRRPRTYKLGDTIDVAFSAGLLKEDSSGKAQVDANPQQLKRLENLGGWRYRACGEVVAVDPEPLLDCGAVTVDLPDAVCDASVLGRFVTVEIERLDCWRSGT